MNLILYCSNIVLITIKNDDYHHHHHHYIIIVIITTLLLLLLLLLLLWPNIVCILHYFISYLPCNLEMPPPPLISTLLDNLLFWIAAQGINFS